MRFLFGAFPPNYLLIFPCENGKNRPFPPNFIICILVQTTLAQRYSRCVAQVYEDTKTAPET